MRSADQRALKLLTVKVVGLKKKSAARPWPHSNQSVWIPVAAVLGQPKDFKGFQMIPKDFNGFQKKLRRIP